MRKFAAATAAILMTTTVAFAAEAEGKVRSVDREKLLVTLDDGKSYKLPAEVDVGAIKEGMTMLIAYDKVGDENQITDMDLSE